jgi:hypothetical protein
MTSVELLSEGSNSTGTIRMGSPLSVRVNFSSPSPFRPLFSVSLKTALGVPLFNASDRLASQLVSCDPIANGTIACRFDRLPLMPGTYVLDLYLGDQADDIDVIDDAVSFEVVAANTEGMSGPLPHPSFGPLFCPATWTLSRTGEKT